MYNMDILRLLLNVSTPTFHSVLKYCCELLVVNRN